MAQTIQDPDPPISVTYDLLPQKTCSTAAATLADPSACNDHGLIVLWVTTSNNPASAPIHDKEEGKGGKEGS